MFYVDLRSLLYFGGRNKRLNGRKNHEGGGSHPFGRRGLNVVVVCLFVCLFVSFRFVSFRFVSFRFVLFCFVLFWFDFFLVSFSFTTSHFLTSVMDHLSNQRSCIISRTIKCNNVHPFWTRAYTYWVISMRFLFKQYNIDFKE